MKSGVYLRALSLWLTVLLAPLVRGDSIVTEFTDETLRAAIAHGGRITFGANGAIHLTGPISIQTSVEMDATGHYVIIDGDRATNLFEIAVGGDVQIIGVSMINGIAKPARADWLAAGGNAAFGAAVRNFGGRIQLSNCVFSNNVVAGFTPNFGAAVWSFGGEVTIRNCVFIANGISEGHIYSGAAFMSASGGSIYAQNSVVKIDSSQFTRNVAAAVRDAFTTSAGLAFGGAIALNNSPATLSRCRFEANSANGGAASGGAVWSNSAMQASDSVFIENLTDAWISEARGGALYSGAGFAGNRLRFIGNRANGANALMSPTPEPFMRDGGPGYGGAIAGDSGCFITNSLFLRNITVGGWNAQYPQFGPWIAFPAEGGAIYTKGDLTAAFCTFATNSAVSKQFADADAIWAASGSLIANIFSGHTNDAVSATQSDGGYNVTDGAREIFTQETTFVGIDPKFLCGTEALWLAPGSPAIDSGPPADIPAMDLFGNSRPSGDGGDRGAAEFWPTLRFPALSALPGNVLKISILNSTGRPYSIRRSCDFIAWTEFFLAEDGTVTEHDVMITNTTPAEFFKAISR